MLRLLDIGKFKVVKSAPLRTAVSAAVRRVTAPAYEEKKEEPEPDNDEEHEAEPESQSQVTDGDDDELQRVVEWQGVKKRSAKEERKAGTSNFLITINPNRSYKKQSPEERQAVAARLRLVSKTFVEHLQKGHFIKGKGAKLTKVPKTTKAESRLEIGSTSGFIHTHALVSFDGVCHIDLAEARKWLAQALEPILGDGKFHFNVKAFADTQAVIAAYIAKGDEAAKHFVDKI